MILIRRTLTALAVVMIFAFVAEIARAGGPLFGYRNGAIVPEGAIAVTQLIDDHEKTVTINGGVNQLPFRVEGQNRKAWAFATYQDALQGAYDAAANLKNDYQYQIYDVRVNTTGDVGGVMPASGVNVDPNPGRNAIYSR